MSVEDEQGSDLIAIVRMEKRLTELQNSEVSDTTKAKCIFRCRFTKNFLIPATHKSPSSGNTHRDRSAVWLCFLWLRVLC